MKYLLDQRVTTTDQQKWITKLMGLDYEIAYKKGKENMVADSLSRQVQNPIVQGDCHAISILDPSISTKECWTITAEIPS